MVTGVFTLLGVWIANRGSAKQLSVRLHHESERENREALRARLEELYSLVGRWGNELGSHYLPYIRVMDGELTYDQALDISIERRSTIDSDRMLTLAQLYFPSAHGALQTIMKYRDEASEIHANFRHAYKADGQPSRGHAEALSAVLQKFGDAIHGYRKELAQYAKHL